jgi:hypothetical protein
MSRKPHFERSSDSSPGQRNVTRQSGNFALPANSPFAYNNAFNSSPFNSPFNNPYHSPYASAFNPPPLSTLPLLNTDVGSTGVIDFREGFAAAMAAGGGQDGILGMTPPLHSLQAHQTLQAQQTLQAMQTLQAQQSLQAQQAMQAQQALQAQQNIQAQQSLQALQAQQAQQALQAQQAFHTQQYLQKLQSLQTMPKHMNPAEYAAVPGTQVFNELMAAEAVSKMYEGTGASLSTAAKDATGKGSLQAKTRSKKGAKPAAVAADLKAADLRAADVKSVVAAKPADNASLKRSINSCVQRRHPY